MCSKKNIVYIFTSSICVELSSDTHSPSRHLNVIDASTPSVAQKGSFKWVSAGDYDYVSDYVTPLIGTVSSEEGFL